jgi:hypothetical protein
MNKQLLRLANRILMLGALLASFSFVVTDRVVYSWGDTDRFAAMGECDNTAYQSTLDTCLDDPNGPGAETCRSWAASALVECLGSVPPPSYGLNFCSMARDRRDTCAFLYGSNAPVINLPAYGECYDASGVSGCE